MKKILLVCIILPGILFTACKSTDTNSQKLEYALCLHGGAGNILKENMSPEREKEYYDKMDEALNIGDSVLRNGGSALDAVELTIHILENSPLFNAGKGAVFTHIGTNELDASIMCGKDLNAGAVAGVNDIKNPISAARKVMENSEHVMLSGKGASQFAQQQGIAIVDTSYFFTADRWNYLQKILNKEREMTQTDRHGTVGCVALDKNGNLAAGTSTGGMTNKKYGRIGDSPIIGAGTYANNNTCAVSCTGHGEYFIRLGIARDLSAIMEYQTIGINQASDIVLEKLTNINGSGGFIALDKYGNRAMKMNTSGMYRAYLNSNGVREKYLYR